MARKAGPAFIVNNTTPNLTVANKIERLLGATVSAGIASVARFSGRGFSMPSTAFGRAVKR